MDKVMLILTIIGTIATLISAIIAVRAKNEVKSILNEITIENNKNATNSGKIDIKNSGSNSGIISGMNTGVMHYEKK